MRNADEEEGKPNQFLFGSKGEILFSDDESEKNIDMTLDDDLSKQHLIRMANASTANERNQMSMSMQFGKIAKTTAGTDGFLKD